MQKRLLQRGGMLPQPCSGWGSCPGGLVLVAVLSTKTSYVV